MSNTTLTKEQVESATKRGRVQHPVVVVLEYHGSEIARLNKGYADMRDGPQKLIYLARNYGFLGDALEGAGDFALAPLDLVAIWSKLEDWPHNAYPRYEFAGMLSATYGIQGRPDLKGLGRYYLEKDKLPNGLVGDKSGLEHIRDRLDHISASLGELDFYVYGVRDAPRKMVELGKKAFQQGDKDAEGEFEKIEAHSREHITPVLSRLFENFGNGMGPFRMEVYKALRQDE